MVKPVAELIPLGRQVPPVLVVRLHLNRNLLRHVQPVGLQAGDFLRVVRQQPDRRQTELGENLVADPEWVASGKLTSKGIEELKSRLPYADLSRLEADPERARDWKAAVATYEDLTGPMSELEKLAARWRAQQVRKEHEGETP